MILDIPVGVTREFVGPITVHMFDAESRLRGIISQENPGSPLFLTGVEGATYRLPAPPEICLV